MSSSSDDVSFEQVAAELHAAGWDPFHPSPECVQVLHPPSELCGLSPMDADGVYWTYVTLRLLIKCGDNHTWRSKGQAILQYAKAFVGARLDPPPEWTAERIEDLSGRLDRWFIDRMTPAHEKLRSDLELLGREHVCSHRADYEPAFTAMWIEQDSDLFDPESDRKNIASGVGMHEQGRKRPRSEGVIPWKDAIAWFQFATRGGDSVARVSDHRLALDPLSLKTRLDQDLGRAKKQAPTDGEPSGDLTRDLVSSSSGTEEAEVRDAAEAVSVIVSLRLAKAPAGTASSHVLTHFDELATGEKSPAALAREVGLSERAVQLAYAKELKAIRAELSP